MNSKNFNRRRGKICVDAALHMVGNDMVVLLTGGDAPHIGALACARKEERLHTVAFPGHRDDVVINRMAEQLRDAVPAVCVIGGIHVDHITPEEIRSIKEMCEELTIEIISYCKSF